MGANFFKSQIGKVMALKILILYATTHGATKVCAEKLAGAFGKKADVFRVKNFSGDFTPYDCVIIGTPVYGGSILKEIKGFCVTHSTALAHRTFAVFFSCLSETQESVDGYLRHNFPAELAEKAIACASFGGAFYFSRLNFLERAIDKFLAKAYAKSAGVAAPDGHTDFVTISDHKISDFAAKIQKAVDHC